ncbi:hypothetical protein SSMOSELEY_1778 [Shigella sonnei str. Moseley]|nr:hypothetical protein SSMOSELEY_1778 [Shigella sonnei str. Moseley]
MFLFILFIGFTMSDRNNDFSLLVKLLNGFLKKDEIKKDYILS